MTDSVEKDVLFYAWDQTALDLAAEHGCLDKCVETGYPLICGGCITASATYATYVLPPAEGKPA